MLHTKQNPVCKFCLKSFIRATLTNKYVGIGSEKRVIDKMELVLKFLHYLAAHLRYKPTFFLLYLPFAYLTTKLVWIGLDQDDTGPLKYFMLFDVGVF